MGAKVRREELGEVEAVDHLLQLEDHRMDAPLDLVGKECVGRWRACRRDLRLHARDPAVQHQRERPALGTCLCGEIADELAIGGETLSLRALQASLRREVGICDHEVSTHRMVAYRLQKEALATPVAPHHKTAGRTTICHDLEVAKEGRDLGLTTHRYVGQTHARHDPTLERVHNHGRDALGHAWTSRCGGR